MFVILGCCYLVVGSVGSWFVVDFKDEEDVEGVENGENVNEGWGDVA